jgi:hypothetical protein
MIIKKCLPHQAAFLQAPYVFKDIRFFFDICGYAAGKTSCLGDSILKAVDYFQGKKDKEGKNPKIGVCGITLTFLQKTLTGSLEQTLRNTKSAYRFDKKANIIYIGNVELILIPIENEADIFGYDLACIGKDVPVTTLRGEVPIKDVVVGDYALTTQGYKRVTGTMFRGVKETIEVNGIRCTPDHRFIDIFDTEIEAQDIKITDKLVQVNSEGIFSAVQPIVKKDRRLEEVYDIEVEDAHEFFAGGIRVHNCCFVDELDELPTHTCIAVVKALNDRCRQAIKDEERSPFLAFTTTSQGLKGTYQTIMNFRKIGMSYMIVRGRTRDNIYLQKEYVEAMYKMYNEKETKCLLEGEFISIDSGLVFPDYNPAFNKLNIDLYDSIEETETVYIGQDFNRGFNKAVACIVRNKNVYVIKTYSFEDARSAPEVFRYDFPYNSIIWVPDMTYKDHFGDFARELKAYKIRIAYRKCNPNIVSRNFAINKMFYARRLFICDFASDLDNALLTHQKDPKTGLPMKGQGESAPDHLTDSLAYVVAHLIGWRRELKDVYDVTMGRALKRHKEIGDDYEDDEGGVNAIDITEEVPV